MLKNRYDIGQALLRDPSIQRLHLDMLLDKGISLLELRMDARRLSQQEKQLCYVSLDDDTILVLWKAYLYELELDQVKRDYNALYYQNPFINLRRKNSQWEHIYTYATQNASIEKVATALLRKEDFQKNTFCPFHKDQSPSLKIYVKTNSFYCFGCHARASPIDFVMLYQNCDFKTAAHYIFNNRL